MRIWFKGLVVLAVVLCFGGLLAARLWNQRVLDEREAAIQRIRAAEGKVTRIKTSPDNPVVAVDLKSCRKLTDAILADVASLPTVRELNISVQRALGDAHLKHFENLTTLEVLWLPPGTTDAGLDHLRRLKRLQTLGLGETAITDAGLAKLKAFPNLQYLFLGGTKVTDAGLEHLKALPNLQFVHLNNSQVTEAGIQALQKAMPRVQVH